MERYVIHVTKECNSKCSYCLSGDTEIAMADFSKKKIKDIAVGDIVLGFDENNKNELLKFYPVKVLQTYNRKSSDIINICFDSGDSINITGNHEIYSNNIWKKAEFFDIGDVVNGIYDVVLYNRKQIIKDIIYKSIDIDVYNFATESRTYIANNICVHNCYEKDKTSTYKWEEIKVLLDNIIKYNQSKTFGIEYLGGEPLLAFDHIKMATEYLESRSDINVSNYAITSNGTIMNDEIVEFLKAYPKVTWAASMDGTKFMNCLRILKTGENTHDIVLANHKWLEKEIGINRLSIHMVTHPFNIAYLSQGVDHLYNEGVRHIGVGTIESTIIIGKEYADKFISENAIISERICKGKYPDLTYGLFSWLKPRSDTRYYIRDNSGKIIAESYGRSGKDITAANVYNSQATTSSIGTLIEDIREIVYNNHKEDLVKYNL